MRTLILDIETRPILAYVWRCWKENIMPKQILNHTEIISVSVKWLNEPKIWYFTVYKSSEKVLLKKLNKFLEEADAVVGHNLKKFDMKKIRGRCLVHGLPPISSYKEIDTYLGAKREFAFDINSLADLARILKIAPKDDHKQFPGFELWLECLNGNPEAWEEMKQYNIQDIKTTEELYLRMRPWMRGHPNMAVFEEADEHVCPKCGGRHHQKRGFSYTNVGKYQQYQCQDCGGWSRSRYNVYDKEARKKLLVNAQ